MAISSLLSRIAFTAVSILRTSRLTIRGDASIHQIANWVRYSVNEQPLKRPFREEDFPLPNKPVTNRSGSFQPPGPAYFSNPFCFSIVFIMPLCPLSYLSLCQVSRKSQVVRQRWPP